MSGYKRARGGSTASVTITVNPGNATVIDGIPYVMDFRDGAVVLTPPPLVQQVLDSEGERLILTMLSDGEKVIDVGAQVPSMEDSGPPSKR